MENYDIVKKDFNEISNLAEPRWNHNNCYFSYLLNNIDDGLELVLEIGCGKGELSNLLAQKSQKVIGVDLADKMIEKAITKYGYKNIDFINRNILDMKFEKDSLDVIITTATAHHLPYEWLLTFANEHLKPGGKLIILDLYQPRSLSDRLLAISAVIPNVFMNIVHNHSLRKEDEHSRNLWRKHGQHDSYMLLRDIKALAQKHLSGAKIKRLLFWRYVLIWKK